MEELAKQEPAMPLQISTYENTYVNCTGGIRPTETYGDTRYDTHLCIEGCALVPSTSIKRN